ncbi:MAG: PhnD/SsuA/transferrin family substrate-binding protein [Desulfovibrionaceae bacterium]
MSVRLSAVLACSLYLLFSASVAPAQQPGTFLIIQPGQPGNTAEAQPVMDSLASYLSARIGRAQTGAYINDLDAAVRLLEQNPPQWAVVSLGFYLQYAGRFHMVPLAATRPGGHDHDNWRVLVAPGYEGSELAGDFQGSMLYEQEAAACLLLRGRSGGIVGLRGDRRPLMALRSTGRGEITGAVLDVSQYEAARAMPFLADFKVLFETGDLPNSPVVWLDSTTNPDPALVKALLDMDSDPQAAELLNSLRTKGFGPPDKRLNILRKECGL